MILVYPFFPGDEQLALKNARWFNELGGCKNHDVLLLPDKRCLLTPQIEEQMKLAFKTVFMQKGFAEIDGWPQGANYFFRTATAWLANRLQWPYFFWMEPDAIPLAENWLDAIQAEYERSGRKFMGDRVQVENIPLHMSGVGVYPNPLHAYAGEAYRAHDTAWDMAGKDQIVPQAHFTKLIEHAWKHPTFSDPSELTTQIRPETVLFHASKDGSLIDLLQSKRAGKHTGDTKEGEEPPSPRPSFICDIFIRTYPQDYPWLKYCLQSIARFCTGFRKIWIVSPQEAPLVPPDCEWKVMNDESEDGYLAQQITKLYADVITGYEPDYILNIDSDTLFTQPVTPQSFFHEGKLIWYYTPYEHTQTPWKPITEKFMGEPVNNEFMRRLPMMVPKFLYSKIREFCHRKHGMIISQYVKIQPYREFSEFNALGAFAFSRFHDQFHWVNTLEGTLPEPFARQFFSWAGITDEVKKEIEQILPVVPVLAEAVATEKVGKVNESGEARESTPLKPQDIKASDSRGGGQTDSNERKTNHGHLPEMQPTGSPQNQGRQEIPAPMPPMREVSEGDGCQLPGGGQTDSKNALLQAVVYLETLAAQSVNQRKSVMKTLSHHGLVPRVYKKKKR